MTDYKTRISSKDPITDAIDLQMGRNLYNDPFLRKCTKLGIWLRCLKWKWYAAVIVVPSLLLIWSKYF